MDISELKLAEKTLKASEERFREAFDSAAIGMVVTETDGRFRSGQSRNVRNNGICCGRIAEKGL